MTQNFSEMSDNFMPELMELDSYWRRAVEDAICDTIKGERRLHYALRNRKKINQKLEKFGIKAGRQELNLSSRHRPGHPDSVDDQEGSDIAFGNSASSLEDGSQPEPTKSRSRSRTNRETPSETKYKSPDRPLLGDGSLEKMKKSQNSFNCEPMGDDQMGAFDPNHVAEFDRAPIYDEDEKNKIHWLHVREDTDFEESDSEVSSGPSNDAIDNSGLEKLTSLRHSFAPKAAGNEKRTRYFAPKGCSMRGTEGKDAVRETRSSLEQRLQLALAKRDIIKEAQKESRTGMGGKKVRISASGARVVRRRRKGHGASSAFIQLYLEVYRELFDKCSPREIASEAAKRWWRLSARQKSKYASRKSKK